MEIFWVRSDAFTPTTAHFSWCTSSLRSDVGATVLTQDLMSIACQQS